jgi:hypothetical protein
MRIALAGHWFLENYEPTCAEALARLGHEVISLRIPMPARPSLSRRIQFQLMWGPEIERDNEWLLREASRVRPDVLWIWRQPQIRRETLERLAAEQPRMLLASYNNDNAFCPPGGYGFKTWRLFVPAIPAFDVHLVLRRENVPVYLAAGARTVEVLRPYFLPEIHQPITIPEEEKSDVVFVGHCERDDRIALVERILAEGFSVSIRGTYWARYPSKRSPIRALGPFRTANGAEYTRAICSGRIALGLISRQISPEDQITRRNFEIPACGVPMLAPFTPELAEILEEGNEALFYRSHDEAIDLLRRYVPDVAARERIGGAARARIVRDGHDTSARMKGVAALFERELSRKRGEGSRT